MLRRQPGRRLPAGRGGQRRPRVPADPGRPARGRGAHRAVPPAHVRPRHRPDRRPGRQDRRLDPAAVRRRGGGGDPGRPGRPGPAAEQRRGPAARRGPDGRAPGRLTAGAGAHRRRVPGDGRRRPQASAARRGADPDAAEPAAAAAAPAAGGAVGLGAGQAAARPVAAAQRERPPPAAPAAPERAGRQGTGRARDGDASALPSAGAPARAAVAQVWQEFAQEMEERQAHRPAA